MFTSSQGPQDYKVVQYIAFKYQDLKEGRDGAHVIASVKQFQIKALSPTTFVYLLFLSCGHGGRIS